MGAHRCWIEVTDPDTNEQVAVKWTDIINLNLELSLYVAADTFDCTLRNDLLLSDYLRKEQEISFWMGTVADPSNWTKDELTHLFTGKIDGVRPYFGEQMTVQLVGRDYSARLIDTEFSVAFAERTAADIAMMLAQKHGLTPQVTPTEVVIEKDLYKDRKEWDILQELADREGFVCYVKRNKILYFGPRSDQDDTVVAEINYRQQEKSNALGIQFDDSLVGVINYVVVRHWLGKKKGLVEGEAKNQALIDKYGEKKRVIYDPKAKTKELADQSAAKRLKEWSRVVVTAEPVRVAGSPFLIPEKMVTVKGCGRFDSNYYIEKARHSLSKRSCFTEISITSQRPDSAAQYRQDLYNYRERTM
jgi:phage protein D